MRTIQEVIDYGLVVGTNKCLNNKQIEYMIKAIAINEYGDDANKHLKEIDLQIIDSDSDGINEAQNHLTEDFVKWFLQ